MNFVTAEWRVAKMPLRIGSDLQRARPRAPPPPAGGCCGTGVPVRRRGGAGLKGERRI